MPKRKKAKKKINVAFCVIFALIMSFAILVTIDSKIDFKYIPSWQEIIASIKNEPIKNTQATTSIHYIDVGQGDCTLIKSKDMSILIDSGEKEYSKKVIDYINAQGIKKLDVVIATHPHADHIGGMADVVDAFKVEKIIMPKIPDAIVPTTKTYTNLLTAIANKGIKITPAKPSQIYNIGEGKLEILGPNAEFDDLNNMSVIAKFTSNGHSTLFTGDMESQAEKDILNKGFEIDIDFLKVAHHGSSSSSIKSFLEATTPKTAVISVGAGNKYNHPNNEVVKRIKNTATQIYRTDNSGTVVINFIDDKFEIVEEKK